MLKRLEQELAWYIKWTSINRLSQRTLSIIVLVCAVLAPITVSSGSEGGLMVFGLSKDAISKIALIVTLTLALAEGLRRIFHLEARYVTCINAREALYRIRDNYLDEQVGKEVGSEEWIKNLAGARKAMDELLMSDIREFSELVKGQTPKAVTVQ
jgi:fumarate reductase subunit D